MSTIQINTLEQLTIPAITAAFNEAFQDYFIPLQFTPESMAAKMKTEGILLHYSIGAFYEGRLIGFMLHAYDTIAGIKTIYNAGTGVIPTFRGKGITAAMYEYCIPLLQKEGIFTHVLEVIDQNKPAIKIYERAGFVKQRHLLAYKSTQPVTNSSTLDIRSIDIIPSGPAFHTVMPAWQNATASINRDLEGHCIIGAFQEGELVGYAVFVMASARIKQLAVHEAHRKQGVGKAILAYICNACMGQPVFVTNVDASHEPTVSALEALQFKRILGLHEMKLEVPQ